MKSIKQAEVRIYWTDNDDEYLISLNADVDIKSMHEEHQREVKEYGINCRCSDCTSDWSIKAENFEFVLTPIEQGDKVYVLKTRKKDKFNW